MSEQDRPVVRPVIESERIASLDVLRGVAVLGILVMNVQAFSMIGMAYVNPTAAGDFTGSNYAVWYVCHLLADQKFYTIFSMLFGAGVALMTSRAEQAGRGSAAIHYRRMGWLILLGLLHAHLLWYGDILYFYGMCGLAVWLFRKMPPWLLIMIGVVLLAIGSGISIGFGFTLEFWREEAMTTWHPPEDIVQAEVEAYRSGWLGQQMHRSASAIMFETFMFAFGVIWRTGGLMLIGMALYELGVFSAARSTRFYAGLVALGLLVALPVIAYGVHRNVAAGWSAEYSFFFGGQYNYWASNLVSLGWIGVVMLVWKTGALSGVTSVLGAVGRMALTNYLLQTIICTTIFYGHGFGLFGRVERLGQLAVVAGVWVVLLVISPIWLRRYRFGPAEWLWRSLTYWKRQPMKRA